MVLEGLDFTFNKYSTLCQSVLQSDYEVMTVSSYIQNSGIKKKILVIRHDVDRFPARALRMARLEQSQGIKSTYYFRRNSFFQPYIIKTIADMDHEIGYHYETLDEAKGNYELAMNLFKLHLEQLREIAKVETICMHGNPLTKWLNRDLWHKYDFREFGLIGEAYMSLKNIQYLSDTGRKWDMSRKFKDRLPSGLSNQDLNIRNVVTTDDLIKLIQSGRLSRICLTIHPERWGHNLIIWSMDQIKDITINAAKAVLRISKPNLY